MSMWLVIALILGLVKLPIAALMLWLPFRNDEAVKAPPPSEEGSDEDGGQRTRPHGPIPFGTHPRRPRRGPHGGDAVPAPARVRTRIPALVRSPGTPARS
jgi:hypothetical protein